MPKSLGTTALIHIIVPEVVTVATLFTDQQAEVEEVDFPASLVGPPTGGSHCPAWRRLLGWGAVKRCPLHQSGFPDCPKS